MLVAIGPFFIMCSFVSLHISLRGGYGGTSPVHLMLIMRDDRDAAACLTSVSARARDAFRACQRVQTRVSETVRDGPKGDARRLRGKQPAIMQP
jgi:hypothetical protein